METGLFALLVLAALFSRGFCIFCYTRSAASGTADGTAGTSSTACSFGSAKCMSWVAYNGQQNAGCTTATDSCALGGTVTNQKGCYECTADNCNTLSTATFTCYTKVAATAGNGAQVTCPVGITACHRLSTTGAASCGACGTDTNCADCTTANCNTESLTPSTTTTSTTTTTTAASRSITCYISSGTSAKTQGSCSSTCYSYSYLAQNNMVYMNGCGNCSVSQYPNCVVCSSNLCNTGAAAAVSWWTVGALTVSVLASPWLL